MMFKVEYELLLTSVIQMFYKNTDIHSHDTRNKNLLWVSTRMLHISVLEYGML